MSWFDEQIKLRKQQDDEVFSQSFENIANSVIGKKEKTNQFDINYDAITTILRSYGFKSKVVVPKEITDFNEQLEYLCRPFGVMYRRITLSQGWYKDCVGSLLGFLLEDDTPVAILSDGFSYKFEYKGKVIRVNKKNAKLLKIDAYCFYKPFPNKKLTSIDLVKYAFATRSLKDIVIIILFMGISTLLGLLLPKISYFLYSTVVDSKSLALLTSTVFFYLCATASTSLFNTYQTLYNNIVSTKMSIAVDAATMMRTLSLPASFFRKYSSGDLSQRISYLSNLCQLLMSVIFSTGFSSLFSLVYISSIFEFAPGLVIPSIIVIIVTISFSLLTTFVQQKISKQLMEDGAKLSGISYAMVSGIRKIRISGSEKRAFARWANMFAKTSQNQYNPPMFIKINTVITSAISLIGTIVMYFFAVETGVDMAQYTAFTAAYGMVFGAFSPIASIALSAANIKSTLEMAKPIMDCVPEVQENKEIITNIKGGIELSNVSFRYNDNMPLVIDDMSIKIEPGQYVAIVGKTGCGKSTLIRLLLGFEKAQKGSIYYDGKDINSIDLKSLRRKIGTVMQDSRLFQGDIYSNIVIAAPHLSVDDAWQAAKIAGIDQDIMEMPMGMNTLITEGSGGISGGQRQRLVIARAIAPKPKVLIFDEATSALDNITQKKVSQALDSLQCTRIVIAHRLSTIKHCDRILYLEDGKFIEDGTYDELIAMNGKFAKLVERQRIDK